MSKQGFRTKREAEQAAQAVLKAAAEGAVTNRTHRTVGEYLDEWLQMQLPRLRATTHHSYAMAVNRIKSGLGRLPRARLSDGLSLRLGSLH